MYLIIFLTKKMILFGRKNKKKIRKIITYCTVINTFCDLKSFYIKNIHYAPPQIQLYLCICTGCHTIFQLFYDEGRICWR